MRRSNSLPNIQPTISNVIKQHSLSTSVLNCACIVLYLTICAFQLAKQQLAYSAMVAYDLDVADKEFPISNCTIVQCIKECTRTTCKKDVDKQVSAFIACTKCSLVQYVTPCDKETYVEKRNKWLADRVGYCSVLWVWSYVGLCVGIVVAIIALVKFMHEYTKNTRLSIEPSGLLAIEEKKKQF